MTTTFITIAEASEKTGRSLSTIRRFIKSITDDDTHADRDAIEPNAKQVAAFKKKGENFTWKIREDLLLKNFDQPQQKEKKKEEQNGGTDILGVLQKELELKNHQIEKQWEVIHALNDRLREGNILMGSLQKRLGPPPSEHAEAPIDAETKKASTLAVSGMEKSSTKKRLFGWMRK